MYKRFGISANIFQKHEVQLQLFLVSSKPDQAQKFEGLHVFSDPILSPQLLFQKNNSLKYYVYKLP